MEKHQKRKKQNDKEHTKRRMRKRETNEREEMNEIRREKKQPSRSLFTFGSHEVCIQFYFVFKFFFPPPPLAHRTKLMQRYMRVRDARPNSRTQKLFGKSCVLAQDARDVKE